MQKLAKGEIDNLEKSKSWVENNKLYITKENLENLIVLLEENQNKQDEVSGLLGAGDEFYKN
jgi:hypothetical protein